MAKINVIINGQARIIEENSTINYLLAEMAIKSPMLVVEKNLEIVPKESYDEVVKEGDALEIVAFFGGG